MTPAEAKKLKRHALGLLRMAEEVLMPVEMTHEELLAKGDQLASDLRERRERLEQEDSVLRTRSSEQLETERPI